MPPFWDFGYKATMLTDTANFRNPHYHQPGDTLDTLNLDFISLVCQAVGGAAAALADASSFKKISQADIITEV
jgi:hypothetical protein